MNPDAPKPLSRMPIRPGRITVCRWRGSWVTIAPSEDLQDWDCNASTHAEAISHADRLVQHLAQTTEPTA